MVGPMEGIVETNVAAAGRTIHSANDNPMPRNLDGSDASSESHNKAEVRKNSNNNVSELVAKSKKAASSLWTLLHAKNCRLGVNMCAHVGCPEAKLMYLHLKTCSAVLLEPCPCQHPGCQDARKLLAHYRRCRDIRARQAQNPASRSQQHVCLVCSLVARHAKFTLDRTTTPGCRQTSPKVGSTSSHFIPSLILKKESFDEKSNGPPSSSARLSQSFDENRGFLSSRPRSASASVSQRFAFSRSANGIGNARGFQALQAAVSCAMGSNPSSTPASALDTIGEDDFHNKGRPRSESLDARSSELSAEEKEPEAAKSLNFLYLAAVESLEEDPSMGSKTSTQSRRRSQSCSVPSGNYSTSVDSMMQKPMGEELQQILGGDA